LDEIEEGEGEKNPTHSGQEISSKIVVFLDGKWMTLTMTLLTISVLWGDDLRLAVFNKKADVYFYSLFAFGLFMFLGEFLLNTVAKEDYKWSFFFQLDFVAAISIIPDIKWIYDFMDKILSGTEDNSTGGASVATTVESARTARIVRLVRLIRLIRIVKLWTMLRKVKDVDSEEKFRQQSLAAQNAKQAALKRVEASRLGKILSEMTTRRVVVMVLVMLLLRPYMGFEEQDVSKQFGLGNLFWMGRSGCAHQVNGSFSCEQQEQGVWVNKKSWANAVYLYSEVHRNHQIIGTKKTQTLLYLYLPDFEAGGRLQNIKKVESDFGDWNELLECSGLSPSYECPYRDSEMKFIMYQPFECADQNDNTLDGCREIRVFARFEAKKKSQENATMRMINTLFVCVLLASMSIQFQNDTQTLVIAPIEKMVNIIKQLAEDPLRKPELEQFQTESEIEMSGKKKDQGPQLETTMLENTILKIGGLLQVGFGEAGAQIIGKNMSSGDGELNIMMPGRQINAVFGLFSINQFSECIDALQEEVTIFINTICCCLHNCVNRWSGFPIKNHSESFLILWKLPDPIDDQTRSSGDIATRTSDISDRALLSLIKFVAAMRRNLSLYEFYQHPEIESVLEDFMIGFKLILHSGWAIEGPIGSDFKVDAAYVSSQIDLLARLEPLCHTYAVQLMMTEKLYNQLSVRTKERIRKIDVIMFGHSVQGLYCFPVNNLSLTPPPGHIEGDIIKNDCLEISAKAVEEDGAEFLFIIDQDVANIQKLLPEQAFNHFRDALVYYISGDWPEAQKHLDKCFAIDPEDGPAKEIHKFMLDHNFEAPTEWQGYRVYPELQIH